MSRHNDLRLTLWNKHVDCPSYVMQPCWCCHNTICILDFHCAHVIAKANGGSNAEPNYRPVCPHCNIYILWH